MLNKIHMTGIDTIIYIYIYIVQNENYTMVNKYSLKDKDILTRYTIIY